MSKTISIPLRDKISCHILSGMKIGFARDYFQRELEAEHREELSTQKRYYRIRTSLFAFCRERNPEKFAELQDADAWKDAADVQYLSLVLHSEHFIKPEEYVKPADILDEDWMISLPEIVDILEKYEKLKMRRRSAENLMQMLELSSRSQNEAAKRIYSAILQHIQEIESCKAQVLLLNESMNDIEAQVSASVRKIEKLGDDLAAIALDGEEVHEFVIFDNVDKRMTGVTAELFEHLNERIKDTDFAIRTIESSIRSEKVVKKKDGSKQTSTTGGSISKEQVLSKGGGEKSQVDLFNVNRVAAIG